MRSSVAKTPALVQMQNWSATAEKKEVVLANPRKAEDFGIEHYFPRCYQYIE